MTTTFYCWCGVVLLLCLLLFTDPIHAQSNSLTMVGSIDLFQAPAPPQWPEPPQTVVQVYPRYRDLPIPSIVFVNCPPRRVLGFVTCYEYTFPEVLGSAVIVGIPRKGFVQRYDLPSTARDYDLWKYLEPARATPIPIQQSPLQVPVFQQYQPSFAPAIVRRSSTSGGC